MEVSGQHHAPAVLPPGKRPGTHWVGSCVGLRAGVDSMKKKNSLGPTGMRTPDRPGCNLVSLSKNQTNKHIRAGEISHTCGISDGSNHELAHRFKFRCTTGMFLWAKGRNCYFRSVVGCVRYTTKCGIPKLVCAIYMYICMYGIPKLVCAIYIYIYVCVCVCVCVWYT